MRQFTSPWPWELTRAAATSSRGLKRGHLLTSFFTASSIFALCSPLAPHSDGIAADKERTLNVFTSLAHQTDYLGNNGRCFNRRNRVASADANDDAYLSKLKDLGFNWHSGSDADIIGMGHSICSDRLAGKTPDAIAADLRGQLSSKGYSFADITGWVSAAESVYCPV